MDNFVGAIPTPLGGAAGGTEVLVADGLRKAFGNNRAVKGVTLQFRQGEVLGLVGENGAGKSTLVAMLSGAIAPDAGTIIFRGERHDSLSPVSARHHGIDAIRQDPALVPTLSVFENLLLGRETSSWGIYRRRKAKKLAAEWLQSIGASIELETDVASLSPAQRQQVEIAKAIGGGAQIAFFDEPTAALGPKETEQLFELIRRLSSNGTSIVYISHRLDEIFEICERVAVMRDGELVADRPIHQLDESKLVELMVGHQVVAARRAQRTISDDIGRALVMQGIGHRGRIRDIDIEFRAGEVHGLFGIVGSGRSRVAGVLSGVNRPDHGTMLLDGAPFAPHSPREAIEAGVVLLPEDRRNHGLFAQMTVASNVVLSRINKVSRFGFINKRSERRAAKTLVSQLNVRPPDPQLSGGTLSGGNQQKVLLARALFSEPRYLVLDEPTQGIDIGAKEDIHQLIHELADSGSGVIVISSDLRELLEVSDRITVLARGRVVETFDEAIDSHRLVAAAVGGNTA